MDGIHDLGGKHGFGSVEHEPAELAFAERWQGAVFIIINSLLRSGVAHNVDYFRHAVERIDPVSYLSDGYYGRWLGAAETMLVEAGVLTQQELTERAVQQGANPLDRIAARPDSERSDFSKLPGEHAVAEVQATAERSVKQSARYTVGQKVRTQATGIPGHTRLPGYARGVVGEVIACHGGWIYPDSNAHGRGEQPEHLYTVAFPGNQLWGDAGEADLEVCVDLFEPYIQSVT